ncbi:hypothetical protein ACTWJ8_40595 (plasmid) [Streptomyces sp. SDT5-1]|uniref:hypothetical protein n=1 Tax=Streptomyces sp. SDT5-1 TaxID=3406418 RepID=UPI003FD59B1B
MYSPPPSDADTRRMTATHDSAAAALGVTTSGPLVWGWHGRTLSRAAQHPDHGACWLRMLSVPEDKAGGKLWEGPEQAAHAFPTVPKPALHAVHDIVKDDFAYRCELSEYVSEPVLAPDPVLHQDLDVTDAWYSGMRTALDTIAGTETDRVAVRQQWIDRAVPQFTGLPAPRIEWACAHGDFHAANLTASGLILDWEGWGMAPRGFDAANLYVMALLVPDTAQRIRRELASHLQGESGRAALLVVCAQLLQMVSRGDLLDLEPHLRALVDELT